MLEHPHLARIFRLVRRGRPLERLRRRLEHRTAAVLHHPVRQREVVPPARVDLDVVAAPERVDRAVPARDRAQPRLTLAEPELVAPVEALAVVPLRVGEPERAARVGDLRVGERRDQVPQRIRRPRRVRVGERDNVARRLAHGPVLRRDLAPARAVEQPDAGLVLGDALDDRVRPVLRGVGRDDDLESVGRVVESEEVLEPAADHRLLVVRSHDDRHRRRPRWVAGDGAAPDARERARRERVADVGPGEGAERPPEERLCRGHRASVVPLQAKRPRSSHGRSKSGQDAESRATSRYRGDRGRRMTSLVAREGPGGYCLKGH